MLIIMEANLHHHHLVHQQHPRHQTDTGSVSVGSCMLPRLHTENMVHPILEQLQPAVWQPEVLQLQRINFSIEGGARQVPAGTVHGIGTP